MSEVQVASINRILVDSIVDKLFNCDPPIGNKSIFCMSYGVDTFIEAVICWCRYHKIAIPKIVGTELDDACVDQCKRKYELFGDIDIVSRFLIPDRFHCDYMIGSPCCLFFPDILSGICYDYFFEVLSRIVIGSKIVSIVPEDVLYHFKYKKLRELLLKREVKEIELVKVKLDDEEVENTVIIRIDNEPIFSNERVRTALSIDDKKFSMFLLRNASLWVAKEEIDVEQRQAYAREEEWVNNKEGVLNDICQCIRCGPGTGAESVFVCRAVDVTAELKPFAYNAVSPKDIDLETCSIKSESSILIPYDRRGKLISFDKLGALGEFLSDPVRKGKLLSRSCVKNDSWYHFHDKPLLDEILQPKILFKAISSAPHFVIDYSGNVVPKHNVHYIIPESNIDIDLLVKYLHSKEVQTWLERNCPSGKNGFLRMNIKVVKSIPISKGFFDKEIQDDR